MLKTIDLFAGCGGFSCGFEKAGFDIVTAVEFDKTIAESYKKNHEKTTMLAEDIKNIDNDNYFKYHDADIIIGGPPCQGFSMAGARIRNGFIDDPRNYLFKHYFNIVKLVRPKIFILENVKGILTLHNGQIFEEIKKLFEDKDQFDGKPYKIQYKVIKARAFGIPQNRERVIIVGSQIDFDLETEIQKTKDQLKKKDATFFDNVTVWDAISNLPKPDENGQVTLKAYKCDYQKKLSSGNKTTFNHIQTNHSKKALERIAKIKINENFTALNESIKSVHSGSYGRLDPNGISPTITTRFDTPSGGRFIHPFEDRTLTPREAARIQSFPDDFEFTGNRTSICKQIGNAVPPKLAYFFGEMIKGVLENE